MLFDTIAEEGASVFGAVEDAVSDLIQPQAHNEAGGAAPAAVPTRHPTVAPTPTMPKDSPKVDDRATADVLFQEIQDGIASEDGARDGVDKKSTTTASQLPPNAVANVQKLKAAADKDPTKVAAYAAAVQALEQQYLSIPMYSSDDPHDNVHEPAKGSMTLEEYKKLSVPERQERFGKDLKVKFAMTASGEMRVGPESMPHVQIAGGPALSAGQWKDDGSGQFAAGIENTSEGYRPGALRNNAALAAFDQAKMIPATGTTSHQNSTGAYEQSAKGWFGDDETPGVNVLPAKH